MNTILVTGGTGAQGGSVARELLRRGEFGVRVMTRTPSSAETRQLRELGAEVVRGDLFDPWSVAEAMAGCYGVFGVTSYWEHFEREEELGANLVDAAADAEVGHLVLSTQPPVHELTNGALIASQCDLKARTAERARRLGVPATFVQLAFYYDNFTTLFAPQREPDGSYVFGLPQGDAPLAGFAVEDTGGIVAPLFGRRDEFLGESLYLAGDDLTPAGYAAVMSRVTGRVVRYRDIPPDVFAAYRFRGAADLADEFTFRRMRGAERQQARVRTRELYPGVQSFEEWAVRHLPQLELALAA